jgi:hypothetical protein
VLPRLIFFLRWRAQNLLVQLFQPVKLSHPPIERKAAEVGCIHGSIQPIGRLSAGEIEIPISLFKPRAGASFRKLFVDRLYGEPHVRSA